jgi:uncharacterized membrane protein YkoI
MTLSKRNKFIAAGAAVLALGAGGAAVAGAAGGGEDAAEGPDVAITGSALEQAKAAALDATGGGSVTGTEQGDEESYYEVEVTRDDGSQVDVQLDRGFNLVGQSADNENG